MKREKPSRSDDLRREYERSDFQKGFVRGKYAMRLAAMSNILRLDPEIADTLKKAKRHKEG